MRFGAGANVTAPQRFEADPVLKPSFSYSLPRTVRLMIVRADVEDDELCVEPILLIVEDRYPGVHSAE
jgi:hypothetical protein